MPVDPIIVYRSVKQMGYQVLLQQNLYKNGGLQFLVCKGVALLGVYQKTNTKNQNQKPNKHKTKPCLG